MKIRSAGHVSLLGAVLAGFSISDAARETMSVTEGGTTFTVVRYDDDRSKPYRLKFRQDGIRSLYMFNSASYVTNIKVGLERYKALYDANDNLENVELTSSTRRDLAQEKNDATMLEHRRLEFAECNDCAEAWNALCAGASSVCNLVDHGSPFSTAAAASIDTVCETFGGACSSYEASEACQDQCTDEEVGSSSNSCLDPASENYKCSFSGDTTMTFTSCDLVDADVAFLPACFEEFGKNNIEKIDLDENNGVTTMPEGTFSGLSELTSLDLYSNKLVTLPEGLFSGLTKLTFLDLAFNDIVTLPEGVLSGLESLQIVRLFNNELTPESLPIGLFSGVPQLQELYLSGNQLTDLTGLEGLFDGLTELTRLGLDENGLVTVPEGMFTGLTKLEYLSFWINRLETLPDGLMSDLTALRTLELSDNNLTSLGGSLSGLTELRTLLLEYNQLVLTADVFSGLTNLEKLDLHDCGLTTLPEGIFSPMENLVELEIWDNEDLQCLPSTTATSIDIDSEDIRDGTCGCTPTEAVVCDEGLSCESGATGYTCVSE